MYKVGLLLNSKALMGQAINTLPLFLALPYFIELTKLEMIFFTHCTDEKCVTHIGWYIS